MLVYSTESQGGRQYMEDRYVNTSVARNIGFHAIFDGHGGDKIAILCKELFPNIIEQEIAKAPYEIGNAIINSFHKMDQVAASIEDASHIGSTVVFVLVANNAIWFANAGDSMSMVGYINGSSELKSFEHKVANEEERITQAGGVVTDDDTKRINHMLNVSRAIGDFYLKPIVICDPYYTSISMNFDNIKYILLASDGIWDVLSHSTINEIINNSHMWDFTGKEREKYIVETINYLVMLAQMRGSTDNITVTFLMVD